MELRKTFQFEAAHLLPRLPKSHKCRRLHGHSFKVEIVVAGECDPRLGWLMDYADISQAFKPIWRPARPLLPERNPRPGEPDEREHRRLDLEEAEAETAAADGGGGGRDLHRQVRVSGALRAEYAREGAGHKVLHLRTFGGLLEWIVAVSQKPVRSVKGPNPLKWKCRMSAHRVGLWLGVLLACTVSSAVLAQGGSIVTVNPDNVLLINGRKVFTIGFSPGPPNNSTTPTGKDALQELRDAGAQLFRISQTTSWNSTVISNQQVALDWAAQHGMYCWVNLAELSQFSSTDTNTPAKLRNVVDLFRNHPALGLWKNADEAWWSGVSVGNLLNGYNVIKQEDTNHPVVQTHAPRGTVADLQPYNVAADVLALDIYPVVASGSASNPPITNTQISQVGDWTKVLSQVADGQKEYWLIEQIAFSGTTPPAKTLIFPTFTQSRYMAYQAIVNGARGLMFYGGNIAATLNAQDTPYGWNWTFWTNVLKPLVLELGDYGMLTNALVTTNSTLPITISGTTVPDLEFCVREAPPYIYILACKRETTTVNVTFSGLPSSLTNGDVLYESPRTVAVHNGQFTDSFAPFDVHVYRFNFGIVPPSILTQPQSQTVNPGSAVPFTVTAFGLMPLSYQWRFNATAIPGATNQAYTVTNALAGNVGSYSVVVTNQSGSVTSSVALLVLNKPPTITSQPQGQTLIVGQSVTFSVGVSGTAPFNYQWQLNGNAIPGATASALTLSPAQRANGGAYSVLVMNGVGTALSAKAVLSFIPLDAWGDDFYGQLDFSKQAVNVIAIAAGAWHNLALRADGTILAWGDDADGQCDVPLTLQPALAVACGGYHSLAIQTDGTVAAWGADDYGQTNVPAGLANVIGISAGTWHSLALRRDGTVAAWGDNIWGQSTVPIGLSNVVAVAAGGNHSLALRANGTVVAWGENTDAEGIFVGQSVVPANLTNVVAVAAGEYHSLAVRADGTVAAWGDDSQGQISLPVGLSNVVAVAGGGAHSLALKADGTAQAWGADGSGQCRLPSYLANLVGIGAGEYHSVTLVAGSVPVARLLSPVCQGGRFSALVQSLNRTHYALDGRNSLTATDWSALSTNAGNGALELLLDPSATGPQHFYRLRQW